MAATAFSDAKRFLFLRPFEGSYDPVELLEQLVQETEQERKLITVLRSELTKARERIDKSEETSRRMRALLETQVNHRKLSLKKFKEVCAIK